MDQHLGENIKGWLSDGTKVEVIATDNATSKIKHYKIKPEGEDTFPSGVNPWIPKYALFDYNPIEGEPPLLDPVEDSLD